MAVWMKKHKISDVELEPKLGAFNVNEVVKNTWSLTYLILGGVI